MFRRSLVFAVALAVIAFAIVACGGGASGGASTGGGSALNVTVTLTEFKFDPGTVNATAGQTVNLTLVNKGSVVHTWVLPAANVKVSVDPGKTLTKTFTAPAAGSYDVTCDEAGHKEAGMVGKLIVK
jgi:plastocyanin